MLVARTAEGFRAIVRKLRNLDGGNVSDISHFLSLRGSLSTFAG